LIIEVLRGRAGILSVIADLRAAAAATTAGLRLWTLNRRDYPMEDVHFYEPRIRR
jgi:predicted nucleic acid-binding protein